MGRLQVFFQLRVRAGRPPERGGETLMRWIISKLGVAVIVASCAATEVPPPPQMRPLSAAEKEALRNSLSQTMKDPDAAKFKWMPAVIPKKDTPLNTPIGYCGLVNGKNSYGAYVGFKRFSADIMRNAKGDYDRGVIRNIEGTPITFGGTSTMEDAMQTGAVEGYCKAWGYIDFSIAN
jgi:hypothetical protein